MVSCWTIQKNADAVSKCIEIYGSWSGKQVNFENSSILFSRSLDGRLKATIKKLSNFFGFPYYVPKILPINPFLNVN